MGARSTSLGHRHAHHQELKELKRSTKVHSKMWTMAKDIP